MSLFNAIVTFFYEILFGCRHEKLTRPFTLEQQTYKVCLDCGRHVFYCAESMTPLTASEVRRMKLAQNGDHSERDQPDQREGDNWDRSKLLPLTGRLPAEVVTRSNSSVAA